MFFSRLIPREWHGSIDHWCLASGRCEWLRRREITAQLPFLFRCWAWSYRLLSETRLDRPRIHQSLYRLVRRLYRLSRAPRVSPVRFGDTTVFFDLWDLRMPRAVSELVDADSDVRLLGSLLNAGGTFIDVGANHGTFSAHAATLVGKAGIVIAIEPQPHLAQLIEKTLRTTDAAPFQVLNCACGRTESEATLFVPERNSGEATLSLAYVEALKRREQRVKLTTLDAVAEQFVSDGSNVVIKIDVEGHELEVLAGGIHLIQKHRPILLMELNARAIRSTGLAIESYPRELLRAGIGEYAEMNAPRDWMDIATLRAEPERNVLLRPRGALDGETAVNITKLGAKAANA